MIGRRHGKLCHFTMHDPDRRGYDQSQHSQFRDEMKSVEMRSAWSCEVSEVG